MAYNETQTSRHAVNDPTIGTIGTPILISYFGQQGFFPQKYYLYITYVYNI